MRIANFNGEGYDVTTVDTFGWYGEDIRVNPDFSPLDMIDLAEEVAAAQQESGPGQISFGMATMVKKQIRLLIHPGDFDTFWSVAKAKRITPETLMEVMTKVMEYISGRPTVPHSDSSDGRSTTTTTSESIRNEPVSPLTALDVRVAEREMEGRPDLRLALVNIAEQRHASVG